MRLETKKTATLMNIFSRQVQISYSSTTINGLSDLLSGILSFLNLSSSPLNSDVCEVYVFQTSGIALDNCGKALSESNLEVLIQPGTMLVLDHESKRALLFVSTPLDYRREVISAIPYVLSHFFGDLIVCIHGSAVATLNNGKHAVVFLGESESGKTTVANEAFHSGLPVIGDELLFLSVDPRTEQIHVQQTGIRSDTAQYIPSLSSFPVGMLAKLDKGNTSKADSIDLSSMLNLLKRCDQSSPPPAKSDFLYFIILSSIPHISFSFPKSNINWSVLSENSVFQTNK